MCKACCTAVSTSVPLCPHAASRCCELGTSGLTDHAGSRKAALFCAAEHGCHDLALDKPHCADVMHSFILLNAVCL